MSLIARIESELKDARLARDEDRRDALSLVLNALQAAQDLPRCLARGSEFRGGPREFPALQGRREDDRAGEDHGEGEDGEHRLPAHRIAW